MNESRVLIGTLSDGTDVLVHVWNDGGGELAFRERGRQGVPTWGVPTVLAEDR